MSETQPPAAWSPRWRIAWFGVSEVVAGLVFVALVALAALSGR